MNEQDAVNKKIADIEKLKGMRVWRQLGPIFVKVEGSENVKTKFKPDRR